MNNHYVTYQELRLALPVHGNKISQIKIVSVGIYKCASVTQDLRCRDYKTNFAIQKLFEV